MISGLLRLYWLLVLLFSLPAWAQQSVQLSPIQYYQESDTYLGWQQALQQQRAGQFHAVQSPVPAFGINAKPVWLYVPFTSGTGETPYYLVGGVSWLDQIDVYLLHQGRLQHVEYTGDVRIPMVGLAPALGYVLPLSLPPDGGELLIRVETAEPMVFPLELLSQQQLEQKRQFFQYFYGFFYGFMLALILYNLLLFVGLRQSAYLYYSLAMLSYLGCNFSYTGHGLLWWSDWSWWQGYFHYVCMVTQVVFILLFSLTFLDLLRHWIQRLALVVMVVGSLLMVLFILLGQQGWVAQLAFVYTTLGTVMTVWMGGLALQARHPFARYYLAAIGCGFLGIVLALLASWGKIPFNFVTHHAVEIGFMLEAILLSLALAYQIRLHQRAHFHAQQQAQQDALTGLYNRRGFHHEFEKRHFGGVGYGLVLIDIDDFKKINDSYGHPVGDLVLQAIARVLQQLPSSRALVSRWGGEEFLVLLKADSAHALVAQAERLRLDIAAIRIALPNEELAVTASLGLCLLQGQPLKEAIQQADLQLYGAKRNGKNQVNIASGV